MYISEVGVFVLVCLLYLLSWVVAHLLCEFKHFWCKGNCHKCHNWQCKYFNTKGKDASLEGFKADICDNYCKYRDTCDEDCLCDINRDSGTCPLDHI